MRSSKGRHATSGARAARIRRIATLMDDSIRIPLIGRRIGLDGLVGLIPGVGDAVSGAVSVYLILEAARAGARKRALARMALNAGLDSLVGAIPVVGDLFDLAFKANLRNARIALAEIDQREARSATPAVA